MSTIGYLPPRGARLRSSLLDLPAYRPGRRPDGADTLKLSANENPYPPLPAVLTAVAAAAADLNRYPDPAATALTAALATELAVPPACIATGTGSIGVLQQIVQAVAGPGDEVVYAWRSFEAYPLVTRIAEARPVPVPLTADERHDLTAMADAVTERTRLVIVCTPNNPTGTVVGAAELRRFLSDVPSDVLVVLDEAYLEFVDNPAAVRGMEFFRQYRNVCLLRTFSKAHGLAGLRVGYAVAAEPVAAAVRRTAIPFGVSSVAQAAAIASLAARAGMGDRVAALRVERARLTAAVRDQGWQVRDSHGNFIWLPLGGASEAVADRCARHGLLVRPYGDDGVRITVADPSANDRLIAVLRRLRHDRAVIQTGTLPR